MRKDWIGLWFELQAERGHSDQAPFFFAHLNPLRLEDHSFRHRHKDGVAAMSEACAKLGLQAARTPRPLPRPPWPLVPRLIWRGLAGNSAGGKPNWRRLRPEITLKPTSLTFLVLGEKEERALAAHLAKQRVSVTAYLLAKLSSALEPELLDGPVTGSWLLPVDMRPAFPDRPPGGNCVSYVKVPAAGDAAEIHRRAKRALLAFEHWSNWWIYHVGKLVGLGGMRKLSKRAAERTFWLGSFTDLGDWTPASPVGADRYRESIWAIAPPGTPNNPVGCASIAWFGRRSISLRIHPSVSEDPLLSGVILRRLAKSIAAETGSSEARLLEAPVRQ